MNLLDYLNERAERKFMHRAELLDRGLDWRSMLRGCAVGFDAKLMIASAIIGLFAAAYFREADKDTRNLMVGALIAAFAGAWGYYLGSSSTASKANDRADAALQLGHDAVKALPAPTPPPDATAADGARIAANAADGVAERAEEQERAER